MRVAFLIPGLPLNSGGHRNILRVAHWLEKWGHEAALHFINVDESALQLRSIINKEFFPFSGDIRLGTDFAPCDVLFATQWSTAKLVSQSKSARVRAYFIQDYEPDFYPVSSTRFTVERSYKLGLTHICHGKWLANKIRRLGVEARHFDYCLDHSTYKPGPRTDFTKREVLFGRPEMPRRCFELGAMALEEIHKRDPSIELVIVGSDKIHDYAFDFPVKLLGHINGATAAELYRNSDLGLAFSTINACGAAYDMMACGLPVLDVWWDGVEDHYGWGDFVRLSDPDPEVMADDALKLLANPDWLEYRSQRGLEFAATFQFEEQMARQVEALILEAAG